MHWRPDRFHDVWISAFTAAARRLTLQIVLYLAEFYLPGSSSLARVVARAREGAREAGQGGPDVRFIRAIFVPADESCFALYQAATAQAVLAAGALAGLVFDRVAEAITAS
jgi:hypothetical protein